MQNNSTFAKNLYIMSVNDTNKSIKVKFPGAYSGQYMIRLSSIQNGLIQSDTLALSVHGTVTGVSPQSGSIYGGTLITITGINFSNDPLDNPVKIGDDYCYVITSSTTQITCRSDLLVGNLAGPATFIVFLKTSEEAKLANQQFGVFTYVIPSATMTDIIAQFNNVTKTHQVVISGTGFDLTTQLYIDGYQQQFNSVNSTKVVFDVIKVKNIVTSDIKVYTSQGLPAGSDILYTISFTPSLLSISPSQGSAGGSLITVNGTGFGLQTVGLNIKAGTQTLCKQVTVLAYGQFTCLTNVGNIAPGTALSLTINSTVQAGFVSANYSQSALINVTTATIDGNSIVFVGSGFPTDGTNGFSVFGNVSATSVVVISSSICIGYWSNSGIATITGVPVLYFQNNVYTNYALFASGISVSNNLVVTSSSSNLVCSFNGGCTYSINSTGLTATLQNSTNSVSFCGSKCKLRTDLSNPNTAVCEVPPLATTYSVNNFKISQSGILNETVFPAGSNLYDNDLQVDYVDSRVTGCQFGMSFKPNYVGVLDEANIFINFLTSKATYVGNLTFQGSNDNWNTFTNLSTYGQEIHEGWNYISYRDNTTKPAFNSYRFIGSTKGACRVTEFRLVGTQVIANNNPTYQCSPVLNISGSILTNNASAITYSSASTPLLTSISPRFGSVLGGTTVTLTGTNLLGAGSSTVQFDDRSCTVTSQTATQIVCVTANKPWRPDTPRAQININGLGYVATQGLVFRYVSFWSNPLTWGGDIPPLEGESVSIPKGQHLLFDIDASPMLNAIIVEGSLIFAPHPTNSTHLRTFDARYIMVQGGYLEVGTEDFPYTSKMQITLYGNKYDPYLPIYGNKVIGVRFGTIDMHGVRRLTTWTRLSQTAQVGATSITLLESTDWVIGDEIVIATTSFNNNQSETRVITAVSGNTYSFAEPLIYQHLSVVPVYNGVSIPMQAEVGLLTRNIVFRGDPVTSLTNQYGAYIMIHSPGDESSIGRIEYVEFKHVGQAYKVGRYPINFHMIGTLHQSYLRGNSIHESYNRAITVHGVFYLRVQNNVAFDTMGHTYFIEDAVETQNIFDHNLAIQVKLSYSLLNTDQTPAGFWITHPDNIFRNNAIAGTDAYGYWFDMQTHPTGPSYDINICPEYSKLGEFSNNTAHSALNYGLRIFHVLIPRTFPCLSSPYDANYLANNQTDPYWQNPQIQAVFQDFIAWKCGSNGAIIERTGAVVFKNFRIADNGIAGIEFSVIEDVVNGYAKVQGGTVVGNTRLNDADYLIANSTVWGFIGPRTENMQVFNLNFFNFDFKESAALGTCSHCFSASSTDSGGRTLQVSGLYFDDATVPRRIKYQFPYREIINDLDGSLTGLGPNTFATYAYPHTDQPECQISYKHNGTICNNSVQIRRIAFHHAIPTSFYLQKLKIAKWDDNIKANVTSNNASLLNFQQDVNQTYFTRVDYRVNQNPTSSWPACYVTGHKYRIHFGDNNIDFTQLQIQTSERWLESDRNVHIMTNFTDVRDGMNVTDSAGYLIPNQTYSSKTESQLVSGDNVLYNQVDVREFQFVINGKNLTNRQNLVFDGYRCLVNCAPTPIPTPVVNNSTFVFWSQNSSWVSGNIPVEGDVVEILSGVNMILDVSTPILKKLTINGRLTFLNNQTNPLDLKLNAKIIYVRAGELIIGNSTQPFLGNATIRLFGNSSDETLAYSTTVEGGNKILAVLGNVTLYGKPRNSMSRLQAPVFAGQSYAIVSSGLDWVAGDKLALMPTTTSPKNLDYVTINSYNSLNGTVTFTSALQYHHWGASASTAAYYNGVDMRGEVILLTRNIKIVGNDTDDWGGQVVVSDTIEANLTQLIYRYGQITFDNVEIFNCSQINTYKSAIRFEGAVTKLQTITNSVIHHSRGWSLSAQYSRNIVIKNTTMIGSRAIGLNIITSSDIVLDRLIVGGIERRSELSAQNAADIEACYSICAYIGNNDRCSNVSLTNSIATGCYYAGFVAPGHDCGSAENQTNFRGNLAHSVLGSGAYIYPDPNKQSHKICYSGSYFSAYKNSQTGLGTQFTTKEVQMSSMTLIDNTLGVNIQAAGESDKSLTSLSNSIIFGETPAQDCALNQPNCWCNQKMGLMLFGSNVGGQSFHITSAGSLPMHKISSYGTWMAATTINNVTFQDFSSNLTNCGQKQSVFGVNEYASDYVPLQQFTNTKFINVTDDAMAYIYDPPQEWNNLSKCIEFPCTGPSNIVLSFTNTTYSGATRPSQNQTKFQIISDTPGASNKVRNCTFKSTWNAWQCTNNNLGVLVFIGDDSDWEDRMVSPVYVSNAVTNFTNKLNNMMDHKSDSFYASQKHKSQFPSMLDATGNFTIDYTGTPFKNMRYKLIGSESQIKIKVPYWDAGVYSVYVNDTLINPTPWNNATGNQAELIGNKGCGENRFVGVQNYLEFILTPNCLVTVKPSNAILSNVRISWTLEEFYASNGVVSFADRVAGALGIHASRIKIVAVYYGSVVVEFGVTAEQNTTDASFTELNNITTSLSQMVQNNSTVFGAPVLNATFTIVIVDPNFNQTLTPISVQVLTPYQIIMQNSQLIIIGSIVIGVIVCISVCCLFVFIMKKKKPQGETTERAGENIPTESELNPKKKRRVKRVNPLDAGQNQTNRTLNKPSQHESNVQSQFYPTYHQ